MRSSQNTIENLNQMSVAAGRDKLVGGLGLHAESVHRLLVQKVVQRLHVRGRCGSSRDKQCVGMYCRSKKSWHILSSKLNNIKRAKVSWTYNKITEPRIATITAHASWCYLELTNVCCVTYIVDFLFNFLSVYLFICVSICFLLGSIFVHLFASMDGLILFSW